MKKDLRKKFQIGVITFGVLFFLVLGGLTFISGNIDSKLYTTVTASLTSSGDLEEPNDPFPSYTLVPSSSIKGDQLFYVKRNSQGDYEVNSMTVTVVRKNGMVTEIEKLGMNVMAICDSNKSYELGETVLVKVDIL